MPASSVGFSSRTTTAVEKAYITTSRSPLSTSHSLGHLGAHSSCQISKDDALMLDRCNFASRRIATTDGGTQVAPQAVRRAISSISALRDRDESVSVDFAHRGPLQKYFALELSNEIGVATQKYATALERRCRREQRCI